MTSLVDMLMSWMPARVVRHAWILEAPSGEEPPGSDCGLHSDLRLVFSGDCL